MQFMTCCFSDVIILSLFINLYTWVCVNMCLIVIKNNSDCPKCVAMRTIIGRKPAVISQHWQDERTVISSADGTACYEKK